MWKSIFIWLCCVAIGAIGGFLLGTLIWKMGFEIIGSTVAIVGAGFGGILVLAGYLKWSEAI